VISSLLKREVQKRPERLKFKGRVLFLVDDADLIRKQLAGEDIPSSESLPLRNDISTDEITPAHLCFYFDETLGEIPYMGLKAGNEFPIARGSVKKGGFVASVSGTRRGKGSSREQSPYAEMCAGIQVVIAKNIERIYKQNCQNLGLLPSTNFALIEKIRSGSEIDLAEFYKDEDAITAEIIQYGGLFAFNVARIQGKVKLNLPDTKKRPMTLAEKIISKHLVKDLKSDDVGVPAVKPGDSGFVRCDLRFSHEYVTPMASIFFEKLVGADEKVNDPSTILFFQDHLTFIDEVMSEEKKKMGLLDLAHNLGFKQIDFAKKQEIRLHGLTGHGSEAICHSKVCESYALPGQVIIGTDSHTPHSGAMGCFAFGIGTTDIFNSWITKDVRLRVPETVRIVIDGTPKANVTAKDYILKILAHPYVKTGKAIGKVIEYAGSAIEALDIDERATMTNMAAEIGGFTGIVAPDSKTIDFLVERRGMKRAEAERLCVGLRGDDDAVYAETIRFDASEIHPMVALPGDPGNGVNVADLKEKVAVNIAYAGSCTAGKREDMDMYARVLKEALAKGKKVHPNVQFFIQFGSQDVKEYCERKGYVEIFKKVGARLVDPSCGACINAGPGASSSKEQIVISAQNRNFPGRSGPGQMYLASPLTVAATAVEGVITEFEG
jgi:3-isopropylmalate/(R)-2-methylmalate dehydratase large subunit